ncbi:hypothetical protein [Methylobacterium trifolii]|uniref:PNPLA domain-containing protein n=1 Tax=Methylobacterium trifolii TaxID=1003092 RepID=A0ABQ4TWZ7_9HYPH|nr:hypothetical protein [Methylobacterium trifolii]GJE59773.1 hypothetical protein MPOCJGCO_1875 [Methylobacterium trifolii]
MVAVARGLDPQVFDEETLSRMIGSSGRPFDRTRCVLPSLYDAWVVRPQMAARDGRTDLLGADDLNASSEDPPGIRSILNAILLDEIRDAALRPQPRAGGPTPDPIAKPAQLATPSSAIETATSSDPLPRCDPATAPPRYLSNTMHVYMTVSNLRGIPFEIAFGNAKFGMLTHGDRVHYAVRGVGSTNWLKEPWLAKDKWINIDTATLPKSIDGRITDEWYAYGETALASAAFPGGLAPRLLTTPTDQYERRQYPLPVEPDQINANFPKSVTNLPTFSFLNVDGGVINNTPFDYVQYAVMGHRPREGAARGDRADRAILMVAPFPEPPSVLAEGSPPAEIAAVLRALFPALVNQARFRASELIPVIDEDDHSRFMISPRRSRDDRSGPARHPIACGLLAGFGGFLDERFRAHDYQLGRRNCQRFLQSVLGLPEDNPAIRKPSKRYADHPLDSSQKPDAPRKFMLIPLFGDAAAEVGLLPWPQMSAVDFRALIRRIEERVKRIGRPFIWSQTSKTSVRLIAWLGLRIQRDQIVRFLALTILADLVRRDQIIGWTIPPNIVRAAEAAGGHADDLRTILAILVGPAREVSEPGQIAAEAHLPLKFVEAVLPTLAGSPKGKPFRVVRVGRVGFALEMFRPSGWRSLPVVRRFFGLWSPSCYSYE